MPDTGNSGAMRPKLEITYVPAADLLFDGKNARRHDKKNLAAIKGSLQKFGQQKPIVVGKDNYVIAGNGTLRAARELGWEKVAVVRTELNGPEATAYAIADNRTAELADWDLDILGGALRGLKGIDFDLGSIGFDSDDLAKFIPTLNPPEPDDDPGKSKKGNLISCPNCGHEFTLSAKG